MINRDKNLPQGRQMRSVTVTFRNTLVQVILVCGARGHEVPFWKKRVNVNVRQIWVSGSWVIICLPTKIRISNYSSTQNISRYYLNL
jgi:hypothetical protein